MATWAQKIKAQSADKQKVPNSRKPRPAVQSSWATVRRPSENDPGEVVAIHYTVDDGVLTVTDEKGAAIKTIKPHTLLPSDDPIALARSFTMERRKHADTNNFNRLLCYPPLSIA